MLLFEPTKINDPLLPLNEYLRGHSINPHPRFKMCLWSVWSMFKLDTIFNKTKKLLNKIQKNYYLCSIQFQHQFPLCDFKNEMRFENIKSIYSHIRNEQFHAFTHIVLN